MAILPWIRYPDVRITTLCKGGDTRLNHQDSRVDHDAHDLETRVGTFKYFDGIPTEETAAAVYNRLDYIRGVASFLKGMPAVSLEAIRRGQASLGVKNYNQVLIFDQ